MNEHKTIPSEKQQEILDFIRDEHSRTGVYPSVREIAGRMGFRSTNTVDYHVRNLSKAGLLVRHGGRARAFALPAGAMADEAGLPSRQTGVIPILGRVAAGEPILAEQNFQDVVSLADYFGGGQASFALRVRGNSMTGVGIFDGDLVIVRQQPRVENGEIGVAVIGDEATVKHIFDDGVQWRLEPANNEFNPIHVNKTDNTVRIAGKVIGVVRKM
ncbi:MAG: transcriptional repressor LexA [Candidatus Sumerlaeota bacterium]|nr:transcriptional repressor LexA [Candidatus Sumerlaeota bacterium]